MSILASLPNRVFWEPGHGGSITRNGHELPLKEAPDLGRGAVYACDYAPGAVYSVTRHISRGPELLEPDEISAARRLIEEVPSRPAPL